ncbi:MAG: hypothetical protein M3O06_02670 [Pseudomonadota bacterium]|nr:hypothetical protein [Pseudomonadota bacterium]
MRDAFTAVQVLNAAGGRPCFDLPVHHCLRHAVEVLVDGDVVVDIDACLVVSGKLVPANR